MTEYASSSLPFSTSEKSDAVRIRMGDEGTMEGIAPKTMVKQFDDIVAKYGDKPALHQKVLKEVSPSILLHWSLLHYSNCNVIFSLEWHSADDDLTVSHIDIALIKPTLWYF